MSNLLQKASIVTTPTAYGVGVLNSIKPAIPFGEELVTNGSFNNGSTGWTIINGTVTDKYNASMTAYQSGIRITPFSYTGTFKVVFDLVITSGNCKFDGGGGNDEIYTTSGTKEKIITNPTKFEFNAFNLGWVGSLDNVSVKEMIDADFDFTRTSSATRVNPDYLIETVSINSANLVQNGNFSELGSELITNGDFSVDGTLTSSYTLGWYSPDSGLSISDGKLIITNGASVGGRAYGTNGVNSISFLTSGKSYKLVYTIEENNDNALVFYHNGGIYVAAPKTVGTHTIYFQAGGTIFILRNSTANSTIKVDNVSVKQVDPNDNWTLGTGLEFWN